MKTKFLFTVFLIFIAVSTIIAQTGEKSSEFFKKEIQQLRAELENLRQDYEHKLNKLDSLIQKIQKKLDEQQKEDELQKLLDEANQLSAKAKEEKVDISKKFHSGVRRQQGLNPNISLGGDFFAGYSTSENDLISEPSEISYGNNGFYMRETEVALVAPLDPFTRGKTFFSVTKDEISIEEAYMEWLNLPLNMNLKMGIFYTEFGPLNRYHDHALPQFDRPRALVNLFSNFGLGGFGAASNFLLPTILFADASSFDLTIVNGGNDFSFASGWKTGLLYTGQFKNYYDLSKNSYLEFRVSGVTGKNDPSGKYNSYVGSFGVTYKWTPIGREKYRTIDWKTEFFLSNYEVPGGTVRSKGFYTSFQNKLNARFWLSGRVGYSELPYDNSQHEWDFTVCLDFWQSEFVFTRFQYQYNERSLTAIKNYWSNMPSDHSFIVQICWAMGPHKHEAY